MDCLYKKRSNIVLSRDALGIPPLLNGPEVLFSVYIQKGKVASWDPLWEPQSRWLESLYLLSPPSAKLACFNKTRACLFWDTWLQQVLGRLLTMFSKEVNLPFLLYLMVLRYCLKHLIKHNCFWKPKNSNADDSGIFYLVFLLLANIFIYTN